MARNVQTMTVSLEFIKKNKSKNWQNNNEKKMKIVKSMESR